MHSLLEDIFKSYTFKNSKNELVKIHSETPREQCEYLQQLITAYKKKQSLEIGFAYGLSTLAITESVAANGGYHTVIDKFQLKHWGGNGLELVEKAGFLDKLNFIEDYSCNTLPSFYLQGKKFDFAYIDSTKVFDVLLVDFFFVDKMLDINGIIVFDDVGFPGIRKLLRYLSQLPHYKVLSQFPENSYPSAIRSLMGNIKYMPFLKNIIKEELVISDYKLGINSSCVALIKIGDDNRNWDWDVKF